ncbi:MAG: hypothetical protein FJX75_03925 [Armatimonadetes bacterium]|nr:hypothetical protein [Armatimonadota bacterium]
MESEPVTAAESPPTTRYFIPTQSCGGLVAAVGVLFVAGIGLLTTLPNSPVAAAYPAWLTWTLRLLPLPLIVLLWAVVSEAEFRIKTDPTAISFRRGLGAVTRVPWREVHDFFADCGRGPAEVAESGGSLVHEPETAAGAPFAEYRPDYVLLSERGMFVFDDVIARLDVLAAEVVAHAPPEAPARWEEASWVACGGCRQGLAISLWRPTELSGPLPAPACPYCGRSFDAVLADVGRPFMVELRGPERRRSAWNPPIEPPAEVPAETPEEPTEPPAEEPEPAAGEEPAHESE